MSFDSYSPVSIDRMGSLVTGFDRRQLPAGVASKARNVRYGSNFVETRWGLARAIDFGEECNINGLGVLVRVGQNPSHIPLLFSDSGKLKAESPVGSGQCVPIAPTFDALPDSAFMEMCAVFQRAYLAFGDLRDGVSEPQVYNGATLDPWSQRPVGEAWATGVTVRKGEIICPTIANSHIYQCTQAGVTGGGEPIWPLGLGLTVNDGTAIWKEANLQLNNQMPTPAQPTLTRVAAAGTFAAGRDVYIMLTLVNGKGETLASASAVLVNTVLNDRVMVTAPVLQPGIGRLQAPYACTGYKIYEADVATGAGAPLAAVYHQVAGGPFAIGVNTPVDATAAGVAPPVGNTADIAPAGNVCTGLRYAGCLFVNRNGNISGFTRASAQQVLLTNGNLQLYCGNLPIGPANTAQRILCFTLPGTSQNLVSVSGPYVYVAQSDNSTGASITMTVVPDNATTETYLNFTDAYLSDGTDVTDRLRVIKLPPQAHCRYIQKWKRIVTVGEVGQPSLARFSNASDPETFYGDTGYQYISRDDGQRLITFGEYKDEVYAIKEHSAYVVTDTTQDPVGWSDPPRWHGKGPTGPRAIWFGTDFIAFAHRSGGYIYSGGDPIRITDEHEDFWKRINWDFGHTIVTHIDEEECEIRFVVPIDGSTEPNVTLTINFLQGVDDPIKFSHIAGRVIAMPDSRKASLDDIAANSIIRAERPLTQNYPQFQAQSTSQVLIASNLDDGIVYMVQPGTLADDGEGYESRYDLALVGVDDLNLQGVSGGLARLGGFVASIEGTGKVKALAVSYGGQEFPFLRDLDLVLSPERFYVRKCNRLSRKWTLGFSNGSQAGAGFKLFNVKVYLKQYKVQADQMPIEDAK